MLPWTKEQQKGYFREYRKLERYKTYKKKYNTEYLKDPEHKQRIKDLQKQWYQDHKIEYLDRRKGRYSRTKLLIFELLGGKCANPYDIDHISFEQNPDYIYCLQIDHVNGKGTKQRRQFKSMDVYYKTILSEIKAGSKNYQLLCANCNWIKRHIEDGHSYAKFIKDGCILK